MWSVCWKNLQNCRDWCMYWLRYFWQFCLVCCIYTEPQKFVISICLDRASITLSNHFSCILFILQLVQKFDKSLKAAKKIFFHLSINLQTLVFFKIFFMFILDNRNCLRFVILSNSTFYSPDAFNNFCTLDTPYSLKYCLHRKLYFIILYKSCIFDLSVSTQAW